MLSKQEHAKILHKLNNIPSNITGRKRQNYKKSLRKKLKECWPIQQYLILDLFCLDFM